MTNKNVLFLTQSAMIAAIYVVLTLIFAPISFGEVQLRVSEALTILPIFTPAAVPGLFVGCLLGNTLLAAPLPDIIFGSLATLIGAFFTYQLRKKQPLLAPIPPIISNMIIIPLVLRYAYGVDIPLLLLMLFLAIGQILSCGVLGLLLYKVLLPYKEKLFQNNIVK